MPVELVESAESFTLSARERRVCSDLLDTLARTLALRLPVELELLSLDVVITRKVPPAPSSGNTERTD